MGANRWVRWDRWMRALHLYTGLFLAPWMMVYAISAFCLNHNAWFAKGLQLETKFENVLEQEFTPGPEFPEIREQQAVAVLRHVDLEGPHRVIGNPDAEQLVMFRYCATGHYRVSWSPARGSVIVDKQLPTSWYSVVNALHFRSGYEPYFAALAWAVIVDLTTTSTVIWVISGIYLWARKPRKRLLGGVCLVVGALLFVVLAVLLCC